MELDRDRVRRARGLFSQRAFEGADVLKTTFECLGAELSTRAIVARQVKASGRESRRTQSLSNAFRYATDRLSEVLIRLEYIRWMSEAISRAGDPATRSWHLFAGLAVKDFHVDVASLMDSLSPVVIQVRGELRPKDQRKPPGWGDIQRGTRRSYRDAIPPTLLACIDSAERWWRDVKEIRHLLTHRDHDKIVFGGPGLGVLFQIYEGSLSPQIVRPEFLWKAGKDIVDFELYSAAVLAEVLTLLDDLGKAIAGELRLTEEGLTQSMRIGDHSSLTRSLDRLIDVLGQS